MPLGPRDDISDELKSTSKLASKYGMDGKQDTQEGTSGVNRNTSSSQVNDLNEQLLKSVYNNDLNKVKELLREGADINALGYARPNIGAPSTPLIQAAEKGYIELFKVLLQTAHINVNQGDYYGFTALHQACHEEMVKLLLEKEEINVNAQDTKYGFTPLINAAWNNRKKIVEKLLGAPGILVNKRDKSGRTALHRSASSGHTEVAEILLHVPGIWVNQKDNLNCHTPLHLAVDLHHSDTAEVILSHPDINVNIKDKYGQTALHTSAYHGDLKVVEILLQAGCNINEKTDTGLTALDWAKEQGQIEVCEMIVKHIKYLEVSGVNQGARSGEVGCSIA